MNHRIFSKSLSAINDTGADGVFDGVSLITCGPALGHDGLLVDRTTLETVLQCSKRFKNGVRVNLDHFSGMENAVGFIDNLRIVGLKLIGTLRLFAEHADFQLIKRQISSIGDTFGFSLFFDGPDDVVAGKKFARCQTLFSADIVPVPACSPSGIFSRGSETQSGIRTFGEACRYVHSLSDGTSKVASMKRAIEQYPELYKAYEFGQRNCQAWTREPLFMSPENHQRRLAIIANGRLI